MTREEHYLEAERLNALSKQHTADGYNLMAQVAATQALVEATLANCRVREVDKPRE
jgi:hypothetical protein